MKENLSIREFVKNPARALEFMLAGLLTQSQRPDFEVNMGTFGARKSPKRQGIVCLGCAATCAVQELTGINLDVETVYPRLNRAAAFGITPGELEDFEEAMESVREGFLGSLYAFFHVTPNVAWNLPTCDYGTLQTSDWFTPEKLEDIRSTIVEMRRLYPDWD